MLRLVLLEQVVVNLMHSVYHSLYVLHVCIHGNGITCFAGGALQVFGSALHTSLTLSDPIKLFNSMDHCSDGYGNQRVYTCP